MKAFGPMTLKFFGAAFLGLQAIPVLAWFIHPFWSLASSLLVFPVSAVVLCLLFVKGRAMARSASFIIVSLLYALSMAFHGYFTYIGFTQGFLD